MQFEFGHNWAEFSIRALTGDRVVQARSDFVELFDGLVLERKAFLDIGFGQGLSLLSAAALGARVVGCDIDPICAQVVRRNAHLFPEVSVGDIPLVAGSILDVETQAKIRAFADDGFDIVHSWGTLHHTGDMESAIRVSADFVAPNGHLVISIYNRHWSSPIWRWIKWLYSCLPGVGKELLTISLYPIIWVAKLAITRQSPTRMERGMDFYYDVVDWVGGFPYQYAAAEEVQALLNKSGFECLRFRPPRVPTGCNEFVFKKSDK
jgi:2-polyprenyl-6-hydroxyphenyl methylase/3-demethylubiquinone-9 3-methyltransferase